jgi:uncharacterized membrane protein YccC
VRSPPSTGAVLSDRQRWHPPGALFPVFAFTACASIPSDLADVAVGGIVAGAAATFALLVGNAGAWLRRRTAPHRALYDAAPDDPASDDPASVWPARPTGTWRHVAPSATAVLLAGAVATGSGIGHPYWAMVSAVVPLVAADPVRQVVRGLHRVVGTALGLGLAAVLLTLDLGPLALVLLAVALQVAAELLIGRNYAVALVAVTPLALLMVHLVSPTPVGTLLLDRAVETVIGVLIGIAVGRVAHRLAA